MRLLKHPWSTCTVFVGCPVLDWDVLSQLDQNEDIPDRLVHTWNIFSRAVSEWDFLDRTVQKWRIQYSVKSWHILAKCSRSSCLWPKYPPVAGPTAVRPLPPRTVTAPPPGQVLTIIWSHRTLHKQGHSFNHRPATIRQHAWLHRVQEKRPDFRIKLKTDRLVEIHNAYLHFGCHRIRYADLKVWL